MCFECDMFVCMVSQDQVPKHKHGIHSRYQLCSITYFLETGSLIEPGARLLASKPYWFSCLYLLTMLKLLIQ